MENKKKKKKETERVRASFGKKGDTRQRKEEPGASDNSMGAPLISSQVGAFGGFPLDACNVFTLLP